MAEWNEIDIAGVAAVIGDATRAKVLTTLADGTALSAGALATAAGVAPSTISEHLGKLRDAKLLTMQYEGRHRYYRLATSDVALALERLAAIARPLPARSLRQSIAARALLRARLCYDHVAGLLGTTLMETLIAKEVLAAEDGDATGQPTSFLITQAGHHVLTGFGIDTTALPRRRAPVRYCMDWTEHRPHLAGSLGAAITARLFECGWLRHGLTRRVVLLTEPGRQAAHDRLGLPLDWDETEPADR